MLEAALLYLLLLPLRSFCPWQHFDFSVQLRRQHDFASTALIRLHHLLMVMLCLHLRTVASCLRSWGSIREGGICGD